MIDFTKNLYDDLVSRLRDLDTKVDPASLTPDLRMGMIEKTITRIKEKLKNHVFRNDDEEVYFFKFSLPPFLSLLIYYTEKTDIECMAFVVDPQIRKEYYTQVLRKIDAYYREHSELLRYYRSSGSSMDKHYFLRSSPLNRENTNPMIDQSFCTVYTVTIATLQAYMRLGHEIRNQFPDSQVDGWISTYTGVKLKWTDTKSGLVELGYSFKEKGTFNNGQVDLQSIFDYLEYVFFVHIDNPYRSFQEILSRKKGYTLYIDKLRDGFIHKIDEIESGYKR